MQKPKNYDETQVYNDTAKLEPGGHLLRILKVEETKSAAGKDMVIINVDTTKDDTQPQFYKQRFDADTRQDKKWPGRIWQLVLDAEGNTNRSFKAFITSVKESNEGFEIKWSEDKNWGDQFKDKLVGGVFRREEYVNEKGKTAWAVKCMGFRSIETIQKGVDVPEDKPLKPGSSFDNVTVPAPADDDYPF